MEDKKMNQGFNDSPTELSEKSKKALRSGTWNTVRQAMKTEVQHFTDAPEIQHFAVEKVSKNDNVYGITWGNLVREYLLTAYSGENTQAEVISDGITYKVLKREEVTSFYDADGNTLFDVENKRLEKEYGYLMNDSAQDNTKIEEEKEDTGNADGEENTGLEEKKAKPEDGETSGEEPQENAGEVETVKTENAKPAKLRAKEKLEKEMKTAKDKTFAEPVIGYLLKRCEEDEGIAQDVIQEHKTWAKCFDYIYAQARKQSKGNCAAVRDDVVYEWAEDYYHKDDKAEEEKKAREAAERKKKAAEQKKTDKKNPKMDTKKEKVEEKPVEPPKPKKNPKEMDGQMNLFSMMGM